MIVSLVSNKNIYDKMLIVLFSLLESTKDIKKVYLIVEDDSLNDNTKLKQIKKDYDTEIVIKKLDKVLEKRLSIDSPNYNNYFTNYCFGKLLLGDLVDEDKILYLDIDTIVVRDISNLWKYNIDDYYVAGVKDFGIEKRGNIDELGITRYINSGVLLFNLKKVREDKIIDKWFSFINENRLIFPDQDALNVVCHEKILYLSCIYNVCEDVTMPLINHSLARIYHYAGIKEDWVVNRLFGEEFTEIEEKYKNKYGWD